MNGTATIPEMMAHKPLIDLTIKFLANAILTLPPVKGIFNSVISAALTYYCPAPSVLYFPDSDLGGHNKL